LGDVSIRVVEEYRSDTHMQDTPELSFTYKEVADELRAPFLDLLIHVARLHYLKCMLDHGFPSL
jgi:hypothetical protein